MVNALAAQITKLRPGKRQVLLVQAPSLRTEADCQRIEQQVTRRLRDAGVTFAAVLVLPRDWWMTVLGDDELAEMGLQRIRKWRAPTKR